MNIRNQFLAICLLTIAVAYLYTTPIHAQATTASIHGTVTDPTGALLSKATVAVVNTRYPLLSVVWVCIMPVIFKTS